MSQCAMHDVQQYDTPIANGGVTASREAARYRAREDFQNPASMSRACPKSRVQNFEITGTRARTWTRARRERTRARPLGLLAPRAAVACRAFLLGTENVRLVVLSAALRSST
ncbi:hypothetical protein X777_05248 [Ooceraea biroi]|uniref:Uncharacterized protein n=1 Tax=Ooceraea biroi TaxID=2015173 RepID=A0A026WGW8_OOCBI|nr:hypothetical protein X777_05248 [Ooceraea biroi]